jgi:hypothetical protein
MMCVGVTPYSILERVLSCIEECPVSDDGYHIKQYISMPVLWTLMFQRHCER